MSNYWRPEREKPPEFNGLQARLFFPALLIFVFAFDTMMMLEKAFGAQCNEHLKTEANMGRRYATLEGKEVEFVKGSGAKVVCKVTGADWNVGLTLQDVKTGDYLLCINGKASPLMKGTKVRTKLHTQAMQYVYDCVKNKTPVTIEQIRNIQKANNFSSSCSPSAETCAFSQ